MKRNMKANTNYELLTSTNIEEAHKKVLRDTQYGNEGEIIRNVLCDYRYNTDLEVVAMKIAVIDMTNSTHLSMYKRLVSLFDLAQKIKNIDNIDSRLAKGDPLLVNEIARNTILDKDTNDEKTINLFSFASKYCAYHNKEIYDRDDYSIYDGIVRKALPHYVKGLTTFKIDYWRREFNYKAFNDCIGLLLDENDIHIEYRRRKFDHFLWYPNR